MPSRQGPVGTCTSRPRRPPLAGQATRLTRGRGEREDDREKHVRVCTGRGGPGWRLLEHAVAAGRREEGPANAYRQSRKVVDSGTLILDESAYCRAYYRFDVQRIAPKPLKAEGEKLLSPVMMGRLQKEVQKRLASKNYDWQKEDWRDHVTVEAEYNSFARKNRVFITARQHHRAARGRMARAGVRRFGLAAPAETGRSRLAGTIHRRHPGKKRLAARGVSAFPLRAFPIPPRQEP